MTMINLTPHPIVVAGVTIPPSGQVARVEVDYVTLGAGICSLCGREVTGHDGCNVPIIPLVRGEYGQPTDLPEHVEGTLYIVSAMVRVACPDRNDLASPAQMVRDDQGRIIGCEALEVSA